MNQECMYIKFGTLWISRLGQVSIPSLLLWDLVTQVPDVPQRESCVSFFLQRVIHRLESGDMKWTALFIPVVSATFSPEQVAVFMAPLQHFLESFNLGPTRNLRGGKSPDQQAPHLSLFASAPEPARVPLALRVPPEIIL
eukprot:Gregarina_sp_Pseudo_9__5160@NODE_550_length_2597_cov_6_321736_g520_i0_p3_GENE_NODE_550_length_2597_cov_6_321736_g520_i0NODE_550_length_2597_cov_6_321736_g520_i0_p3_ORF_typecomplete_len140_score16_74CLAMP/PF14769_6/1_1e03CLAMP/PF14769_6/1_2_NODE_550_length_2597_cov_6_321736_g520_i020322451